jgi:type II secretory pathway pseudopilin PulG
MATGTRTRSKSGFTLIELLVVIIGLVIVAAAVVPTLRGAGHQQDLSETAARVEASARYARNEAMARQETIVLTVETSPAVIRLAVDNSGALGSPTPGTAMGSPGGMGTQSTNLALPVTYALVPLPTRVQAHMEAVPETFNGSPSTPLAGSGNLDALRFPPDGRTTGGMVVLTDQRGRTVRVTVAPDTGVVQVAQGNA